MITNIISTFFLLISLQRSHNVYYKGLSGAYSLVDSITNPLITHSVVQTGMSTDGFFYVTTLSKNICHNHIESPKSTIVSFHIADIDKKKIIPLIQLLGSTPNPAKDNIEIHMTSPQQGNIKFSLVDMQGRILEQKQFSIKPGKTTINQDLQNYKPGIYFYTIEFSGISKTGRFVILK